MSRRRRRHVMSRRRRRHVMSRRRRRHRSRRGRHVSRRRRRRRHVSRRRRRRNHKDRWRRRRRRRSHKDGRWRRRRRNHKDGRRRRGKNVSDQSDNFRSQSDSAVAMISWRRRWRRWRVCECGYDRSRGQQTNKQFFHGSLLLDGCCFLLRNGRRLSSEALDNPEKADCALKRIGICEH